MSYNDIKSYLNSNIQKEPRQKLKALKVSQLQIIKAQKKKLLERQESLGMLNNNISNINNMELSRNGSSINLKREMLEGVRCNSCQKGQNNFYDFRQMKRIDDFRVGGGMGDEGLQEHNANILLSYTNNLRKQFMQRKFGKHVHTSLRDSLLFSNQHTNTLQQKPKIEFSNYSEQNQHLSNQNLNISKYSTVKVDEKIYLDVKFKIEKELDNQEKGESEEIVQKIDQSVLRKKFLEKYKEFWWGKDKKEEKYKEMVERLKFKSYVIKTREDMLVQDQNYNDYYKYIPQKKVVIKQEDFIQQILEEEPIQQEQQDMQEEHHSQESIHSTPPSSQEDISEVEIEQKIANSKVRRSQRPSVRARKAKKDYKNHMMELLENQKIEEVEEDNGLVGDYQYDQEQLHKQRRRRRKRIGPDGQEYSESCSEEDQQDNKLIPDYQYSDNQPQNNKPVQKKVVLKKDSQEEEIQQVKKRTISQSHPSQEQKDNEQQQENDEQILKQLTQKRIEKKKEEMNQQEEEKQNRLQHLAINNDEKESDESDIDLDDMDIAGFNKARNTEILDKLLAAKDLFDLNLQEFNQKKFENKIDLPEDLKFENNEEKNIFNEIYIWKKELSMEIEEDKKQFIKEKKRIVQIFDDADSDFLEQNKKVFDFSDSESSENFSHTDEQDQQQILIAQSQNIQIEKAESTKKVFSDKPAQLGQQKLQADQNDEQKKQ